MEKWNFETRERWSWETRWMCEDLEMDSKFWAWRVCMESLKDWELASVGVRVMESEKKQMPNLDERRCMYSHFKMVKTRGSETWMEEDWNEKRKVCTALWWRDGKGLKWQGNEILRNIDTDVETMEREMYSSWCKKFKAEDGGCMHWAVITVLKGGFCQTWYILFYKHAMHIILYTCIVHVCIQNLIQPILHVAIGI